ncbi:MAG: hypothetical protein E6G85_13695 [Alphaproteobacteria bacterium]|nr:MAG: hypothetical protein E6G85_13695 [Alphaproteobacteria bacterium]
MTHRMYGTFIASLSAAALMLAANETFARSGGAVHGAFASTHAISHRPLARSLRHHGRNNLGTFWPGVEDYSYGPSSGEPLADGTQPASGDVRYTYDVPWDWAHRYPPIVTPSDRPYVSSCPSEAVTVPRRNGQEQTVNIIRCY